jgi:chemotaxis response regulator CheB
MQGAVSALTGSFAEIAEHGRSAGGDEAIASAAGMARMKSAGAYNIAQDEHTCVVLGMPRQAIAAGAVDEVLPLGHIHARMLERIGA